MTTWATCLASMTTRSLSIDMLKTTSMHLFSTQVLPYSRHSSLTYPRRNQADRILTDPSYTSSFALHSVPSWHLSVCYKLDGAAKE